MFQVGDALPVEIVRIVQRKGDLLLESLLALSQPNCWRHDGSIQPYIFGGVITIPTLCRIILEVCNNEFIFRQLSGVLEK